MSMFSFDSAGRGSWTRLPLSHILASVSYLCMLGNLYNAAKRWARRQLLDLHLLSGLAFLERDVHFDIRCTSSPGFQEHPRQERSPAWYTYNRARLPNPPNPGRLPRADRQSNLGKRTKYD